MTVAFLIAVDCIRALLHKRLLVALMLVTLGLTVGFSMLLDRSLEFMQGVQEQAIESQKGEMSEAEIQEMRSGLDMAGPLLLGAFFWMAMFGGQLVALYICCTAVSGDIRSGTIRIVLAKPVSRDQFLLGKFCGAVIVMLAYSALIGAAIVAFTHANDLDANTAAHHAPWLMFCQILVVGSVGMLLSLLIHPLLAGVAAFFASASLLSSPNPLYFILPSYDRFNVTHSILTGEMIDLEDVLLLTAYAVDVAAIVMLLALWRFRTREVA